MPFRVEDVFFVNEVLFLQEGTRVDASDILNTSFGLYIIVWGYPPPTNSEIIIIHSYEGPAINLHFPLFVGWRYPQIIVLIFLIAYS